MSGRRRSMSLPQLHTGEWVEYSRRLVDVKSRFGCSERLFPAQWGLRITRPVFQCYAVGVRRTAWVDSIISHTLHNYTEAYSQYQSIGLSHVFPTTSINVLRLNHAISNSRVSGINHVIQNFCIFLPVEITTLYFSSWPINCWETWSLLLWEHWLRILYNKAAGVVRISRPNLLFK
jgi:hypothetical protein